MRIALAVFAIVLPVTAAHAKATPSRTGCSSTLINIAQEGVNTLERHFNAGDATGVDLATAKIQLADARFCGDYTYPLADYCAEKTKLLKELLKMRTNELNAGSAPTFAPPDTAKELAQFQEFCSDKANRDY